MAKKSSDDSPKNILELKKLLADLEKSILITKKQIVAEDKKSADYLEKMAKLDAIRSKNRNEYQRIMGQINKIEKESEKKEERQLKNREKILKNLTEEHEAAKKLAHESAEQLKIEENAEKILKRRKDIIDDIYDLEEKSSILMRSVNQDTAKRAEVLKITGKLTSEIAGQTGIIKKLLEGTTDQALVFENTLKHTTDNASKIDQLTGKILENMENTKKKGYELIDTYEIEKSLKEQSARLDLNATKMGAERYSVQRKLVDAQKKEFEKLKQVNQQMAEKVKKSKETRANIVGWIAAVPLGAFLMNKMGLGKIITGTRTVKETIKDWGTALKGFAAALPFMALGGIFSLLVTVIKKLVGMVF